MAIMLSVTKIILDFMLMVMTIVVGFLAPFIVMIVANIVYLKIKGFKRIKSISKWKQKGILYRLLWEFPKQFAYDFMTRDPNKFPYHGTVMFCGHQGCGKTISLVYFLQKVALKYPESHSYANFDIFTEVSNSLPDDERKSDYPDKELVPLFNGWRSIVDKNNGEKGITFCIDELTIWFNNKDSKDFPPEFLQDLNQQRKQRKMTIGTAQRFGLLAKDLRALPEFVYLPHTFFGCITFVLVARPEDWNDEKNNFKKYDLFQTWFFVHDRKLRESYDTFQRVQRAAREGFVPNAFRSGAPTA